MSSFLSQYGINPNKPNNNLAGTNQNGVAPIFWTDDRVEDLRQRWSAGESASVIADAFGTTRNSIIGKVRRLNLERRVVKIDARGKNLDTAKKSYRVGPNADAKVQAINRKKKADGPPVKAEEFIPRTVALESLRKNIVDVGLCTECHYPDEKKTEDDQFTFCGHPVKDGSSYCRAHHALVTGKSINITEDDRARRRTHAAKVWFGASVKIVGNPAEIA